MKNVGAIDRIVRLIMAGSFVALYAMGTVSGAIGITFLVLSVVLVLTSLIGFCPLYFPFGWSSRRRKLSQKATTTK